MEGKDRDEGFWRNVKRGWSFELRAGNRSKELSGQWFILTTFLLSSGYGPRIKWTSIEFLKSGPRETDTKIVACCVATMGTFRSRHVSRRWGEISLSTLLSGHSDVKRLWGYFTAVWPSNGFERGNSFVDQVDLMHELSYT